VDQTVKGDYCTIQDVVNQITQFFSCSAQLQSLPDLIKLLAGKGFLSCSIRPEMFSLLESSWISQLYQEEQPHY